MEAKAAKLGVPRHFLATAPHCGLSPLKHVCGEVRARRATRPRNKFSPAARIEAKIATFKAKYAVSDEAWNALPNAPGRSKDRGTE
jgi:hypothetical protein